MNTPLQEYPFSGMDLTDPGFRATRRSATTTSTPATETRASAPAPDTAGNSRNGARKEVSRATYIMRRIAVSAGALTLAATAYGVVKATYNSAKGPDCTFSGDTKTATLDGGFESAARQIDGIKDGSGACVDEAIQRIKQLNPNIPLSSDGRPLAGATVIEPVSVKVG